MALFKLIRMQQANELQHAKAAQTMRSSIYDKVERGRRIEREIERLATLQTEGCSSKCSAKQEGEWLRRVLRGRRATANAF